MDQSSPWGMVVHSPQEWDFNELATGGVAWVRLDFPWHDLAGLGSTPDWAVDEARYAADTRWTNATSWIAR